MRKDNPRVRVRSAYQSDIEAIVKISVSSARGPNPKDIGLVSDFSTLEYENFLNDPAVTILIAENCQSDQIIGFLLGYMSNGLKAKFPDFDIILSMCNDEFAVIKQVAVDSDARRMNVAGQLMKAFLELHRDFDVYSATVETPQNVPSIRLHEAHGFHVCKLIPGNDSISRQFWKRSGLNKSTDCSAIFLNQYNNMISMYQHEDSLSWQKFHSLMYTNAGLLAALGLLFSGDILSNNKYTQSASVFLPFMVVLAGIIVSFGFHISLRSGVEYMNEYKRRLFELDKDVTRFSGHVFSPPPKITRTAKLLRLFPLYSALFWSILLIWIILLTAA